MLRTLGRRGVTVHAMVEDRFTPAALSRYTARRFVRPTTPRCWRPGGSGAIRWC
ncbi:hypothetical protein [Streptacidiphilus sp. P02-A3a]|uniref:hypothetical protein n=1 Tax=Streptacidiphilus sp. P02-A3a TaxID=2704468 RepID=UPI0015F9ACFD|nr:hypothetical protein [Streptacidiphilus sp. P02-A3a]QMU70778.1 hypothetical protein GXP74_23760 [Streptacidiphilus sp. P02-A3a]